MLGLIDTIPCEIMQLEDSKQDRSYFSGSVITTENELLFTEFPSALPIT